MAVNIQKGGTLVKVASNTVSDINLGNYATMAWIDAQGFADAEKLEGYATKKDLENADSNEYVSISTYNGVADKNTNGKVYFVN